MLASIGCPAPPADRPAPGDPGDSGDPGDDPEIVDRDLDGSAAGEDCDDDDPEVRPGADERCNAVDDDCDDEVDEDPSDPVRIWTDGDGDPASGRFGCLVAGVVEREGDCDDGDAARFPGALELCNGQDDDCDEGTPEIAQIGALPYPTLEDAIAAAADGATVTVCAGIHPVHDLRIERPVVIAGATDDPAQTVLDAEQRGSVFVVTGGASLTVEDLTLTRGTGQPTPGLDFGALAGGAIDALIGSGGPVVVRGCVLEENTADYGGAVAGIDITIEDSVLRRNRSTSDGGAIYHDGPGPLALVNATFDANVGDLGGAVFTRGDLSVTGSTFTANEAAAFGGALALLGRRNDPFEAVFGTTTVEGNQAAEWGGGIYVLDAHVTLDDATLLTGNHAPNGGGAYVIGDARGLSWTGGRFEANGADNLGGGLYFAPYDDDAALSWITVVGNTAGDGGGVFFSPASGTFTDATVEDNVAVRGGGIAISYAPTALERVVVVGNKAVRGGGIHQLYDSLSVLDSVIAENVATAGGGFYTIDADVTVTNTDFGADATDNLPEDVLFEDERGDLLPYSDFGAAVSFECRATWRPGPYGCFSPGARTGAAPPPRRGPSPSTAPSE